MVDTSDFIASPSRFSKGMLSRLLGINSHYRRIFKEEKNPLKKLANLAKCTYWYHNSYDESLELLSGFGVKYPLQEMGLEMLKKEFLSFYAQAIRNNFIYAFCRKEGSRYQLMTKEEEKNFVLKNLTKVTCPSFLASFGHYSLNRFEPAERRFSEYAYSELKSISRLMRHYKLPEYKIPFNKSDIGKYGKEEIYHYLRDEYDYYALKFIAEIRKRGISIKGDYFEKTEF